MKRWQALLVSAVLPPAGILMLWMRSLPTEAGVIGKAARVLGRLLLTGPLILTLGYLVKVRILHTEMSGAGYIPIFTFRSPQQDQDALEKHRQAMQAAAPPAASRAQAAPSEPEADRREPPPLRSGRAGATAPRPGSETHDAGTVVALPTAAPGLLWPEFRGAARDGVSSEGPILTAWPSEGLRPLWKQPVGGGYASFSIAGGRAFTIEQRRDKEVVAAYDVETGRELWMHDWPARFSESMGGDGPRATPTWHHGRVYALGALGELRVLEEATGTLVWSKHILADNGAQNIMWGMANSPLIVDKTVVVTPGGSNGKSLVAYHKDTGERVWNALDDQAAYTSPVLSTLAGEPQLLVVTAKRIVGVRPENGALLWEHPWATMYDINSAQPIVTDANHVLVSAGYGHGSVLLEVNKAHSGFVARALWESKSMKSRFNSAVLHEGHIYGFDESIFVCIDAKTGERRWKGGRYGYGQAILAGGHVIVLAESGELMLLKASPESLQEIARFQAIEGKTWSHPAMAGGLLLVRNSREMAAFRIAP